MAVELKLFKTNSIFYVSYEFEMLHMRVKRNLVKKRYITSFIFMYTTPFSGICPS